MCAFRSAAAAVATPVVVVVVVHGEENDRVQRRDRAEKPEENFR